MIEIKNLCKTYSEFSLQNVSFTVPDGYVTGFIGPNGAGKTTTIKSILGMVGQIMAVLRFLTRRRIQQQTKMISAW